MSREQILNLIRTYHSYHQLSLRCLEESNHDSALIYCNKADECLKRAINAIETQNKTTLIIKEVA